MQKISSLLAFWGIVAISFQPCVAQLVPDSASDRNLDTTIQQITPEVDLITGGTRPSNGINLFHSFTDFNVSAERGVYFETPTGVQNILTRVTGTNRSNISGILGTTGNANLFLLNPNGIVFNNTAILDVQGSFTATTANAIAFGEIGRFSASNPQASVLLNIQPSALPINQLGQSGSIELNQVNLSVPLGQNLFLVGGAIRMDGGLITAFDGRVELGGLAEAGAVDFKYDTTQTTLVFPSNVARSDVTIANNGLIGVFENGSGSIEVHARNFELSSGSDLFAGTFDGQGTEQPGKITIDATDTVTLKQQSSIVNFVGENLIGKGGDIEIRTGSLSILDGSFIDTFHNGQGNSGNIIVDARDRVVISGSDSRGFNSSILTTGLRGTGNVGDIRISAGTLELIDGGRLETGSNRLGSGGNIVLDIRDRTTLHGTSPVSQLSSGVFADLNQDGVGRAGNIQLTTGSLSITDGATIQTNTYGRGNSSNISIDARDSVVLDGVFSDGVDIFPSGISSDVSGSEAIGNGGTIQIAADSLTIKNGASISAGTSGSGDGGKILINVHDRVTVDGQSQALITREDANIPTFSSISTLVLPGAIGNSGEIQIAAGSVDVNNGGGVFASTSGEGNGGNIIIRARDRVLLDGIANDGNSSSIRSGTLNFTSAGITFLGLGNAGSIEIEANDLIISDGAFLSTVTEGQGNAGNINLTVRNALTVQGSNPTDSFSSAILAAAGISSTGQGGSVQITAPQFSLLDSAKVFVGNFGQGNAGTLSVNADRINLDNKSAISSASTSGNGGNIFLNAQDLILMERGSFINTSASGVFNPLNSGNGGNITINTKFLVSTRQENTDIIANAFQGQGGNVTINAQGIFGFTPRSQSELVKIFGTTDLTSTDFDVLPTNDIIAVSRANPTLSGRIQLNLPEVDPSQGLTTLPTTVVDRTTQIVQGCQSTVSANRSSFINTGRGGVPASPTDSLTSSSDFDRWITLNPSSMKSSHQAASPIPQIEQPSIVEAQGWVQNANGTIALVAAAPFQGTTPPCY